MNGVWVVYIWNSDPVVQSIHADELEARRHCDMGSHVVYVPFGAYFRDAL